MLAFATGIDFVTAVALRRMDTANGATPFYLLAPEIAARLHYMPNRRHHHFLVTTLWNTGARIGEACSLTPESFMIDVPRPFVEGQEPAGPFAEGRGALGAAHRSHLRPPV